MRFDLLQGFALGLGQQECGGQEVDDRESRKQVEHRRVAVLANEGQEDGLEDGRNELVEDEGDAHAVGADARGHEFRERQPDADAGAGGVEGNEHIDEEGDEPAMAPLRYGAEDSFVDFEGSGFGGFEVGKGILKERLNLVGRHCSLSRN